MAYNYGGAVNGVDDDSQALYRRKAQTAALATSSNPGDPGIGTFNAVTKLRTGRNPGDATDDPAQNDEDSQRRLAGAVSIAGPLSRPAQANTDAAAVGPSPLVGALGNLNSAQRAAQAYNAPAGSTAERAGQLVRTGYNIAQIPGEIGARAIGAGVSAVGNTVGNFAKGIAGGISLPSPISSASAAEPAAPPLRRPGGLTTLPTMTVNAPAAAPQAGGTVPLGRTFGTRAPDGSIAFSNIPGQVGYDPGYDRAGDNIQVAPAAAPNATAGIATLPGALTRPANNSGDQTYDANKQAASSLTSILNRDPRSALGIAARNAQVDAQSGFGSQRQRTAAYQQQLGGLVGQVAESQRGALQSAEEAQRGQNNLDAETLRGQNELANTNARSIAELSRPQYETDATGNLVRVTGTSAAPVVGADKNPLAVQTKLNGPADATYHNVFTKAYATHLGLSEDPDTAAQNATKAAQAAVAGMRSGTQPASVGPQLAKAKDGTPLHLSADGKSWVTPDGKPYAGDKNG